MRLVAALMCVVLLLAGCTGEPEPKVPDATPTPTVTATPPEMPEIAREESSEGATAFLQHYVEVLNHAATTGDVEELKRLSSSDCSGCQKYIDAFVETYAAGGWMREGEWSFEEVHVRSIGHEVFLTTEMAIASRLFQVDSDSPESRSEPSHDLLTFALARTEDGWEVTQFARGNLS